MKDLFDGLDSTVVQTLSDRPEALNDTEFVKAAVSAQTTMQGGAFDPRSRTPINIPLTPSIIYALNLGLLSEYFETELYSRALNVSTLIPNELRQVFVRILLNEVMQREILLTLLGNNSIVKPNFDFTANRRLFTVFSQFSSFVALAQASEDLGERAYKGQAGNVIASDFALVTALRFHSVEARHASELRRIRGEKGWKTLNSRGTLPAFTQAIYDGEEVTVQGGVDLVALTGLPATTVSESFDEPISGQAALNIVSLFVRGPFSFPPAPTGRGEDSTVSGDNIKF